MSKSDLWDYNALQVTIQPRVFWFLLTLYLTKYSTTVKLLLFVGIKNGVLLQFYK